jgi:sulfur-carrier protein
MGVKIIIPWTMVYITNDVKEFEVEGNTVGVCLEDLIERIPRLKPEIFSEDGTLKTDILIYVNDESVYPDPLKKNVTDGDTLAVMTLIAGG